MTTPALFDAEPVPVKGKPWPWPQPAGFDTRSHRHCTAISSRWNYCARDDDHAGPHAECNAADVVTAVWESRTVPLTSAPGSWLVEVERYPEEAP